MAGAMSVCKYSRRNHLLVWVYHPDNQYFHECATLAFTAYDSGVTLGPNKTCNPTLVCCDWNPDAILA
jgi:hypothetical protein